MDHELIVESNCSGSWQSARYAFYEPDFSFECGPGLFVREECSVPQEPGVLLEGEDILSVRLIGNKSGMEESYFISISSDVLASSEPCCSVRCEVNLIRSHDKDSELETEVDCMDSTVVVCQAKVTRVEL